MKVMISVSFGIFPLSAIINIGLHATEISHFLLYLSIHYCVLGLEIFMEITQSCF